MSEILKETSLEDKFITHFNELESRINGESKSAFHDIRKEALESFKTLGLPDKRNEEYKYTPVQRVLKKNFDFGVVGEQATLSADEIRDNYIPGLKTNTLVFINGVFSEKHSEIISKDIIIKDFNLALKENKEDIETYLAKYADYKEDAFVALNTALAENGSFIKLENNKVIEEPIALYFINDAKSKEVHSQPRNLFIAGKSSQASFIEVFKTTGEQASFTNVVTEVVVNENAHIDYFKIQNNENTSYHVGTTHVWQDRSSYFAGYTFTLSGALVRNNLNIIIDGEGCESHMFGLYLLNGSTHVDNHTAVDHRKPNSFSNELYKGILEDQSHGVFNGKVYVRQIAQKTNAFQSNKNILLSNEAIINTKPQLEIWADDVKCSHGCTTGQLDEEALFYLQSRGVGKERARVLLLYAYAAEILENIKLDPLKDYLEGLVSERLHKNF
ncbi:Fe-S cluster assembly protein SufD [Fulvivirga sediminis]|uniref:Fe-S cluster assembly protein SufD n=1 Tax=Fulvivirga sediminis TaxID=2803949 RepID=A0A937F849_9BACT|nr:Fe-S cluster assembly protein SufD [Fulvivirga sediminis]MBL3656044.1 Fe-S cluster assembly protein SufD [Fulvivirga sediminis]